MIPCSYFTVWDKSEKCDIMFCWSDVLATVLIYSAKFRWTLLVSLVHDQSINLTLITTA